MPEIKSFKDLHEAKQKKLERRNTRRRAVAGVVMSGIAVGGGIAAGLTLTRGVTRDPGVSALTPDQSAAMERATAGTATDTVRAKPVGKVTVTIGTTPETSTIWAE